MWVTVGDDADLFLPLERLCHPDGFSGAGFLSFDGLGVFLHQSPRQGDPKLDVLPFHGPPSSAVVFESR